MQSYTLGERIGSGAMGEVYAGLHITLDCPVAVKIMKPWLAQDADLVQRFLREARLCAAFDHPGIVRVYDVGKNEDGVPYLIMERLTGQTVRERLTRGPLPEAEAAAVARATLAALAVAHTEGVIHRDIKPGNVFLCENGAIKVTDFGIAKAMDGVNLTRPGALLGTPEYMSPELIGGKAVDGRSDMYSVGILLYEMLIGVTPFHADQYVGVLHQHPYAPPPPLPNTIAPEIRAAIERALAKDPEQRFQSVQEMLRALESGGVSWTVTPTQAPTPTPVPLLAPETKPSRQRLINLALALALVGLLLWMILTLARTK